MLLARVVLLTSKRKPGDTNFGDSAASNSHLLILHDVIDVTPSFAHADRSLLLSPGGDVDTLQARQIKSYAAVYVSGAGPNRVSISFDSNGRLRTGGPKLSDYFDQSLRVVGPHEAGRLELTLIHSVVGGVQNSIPGVS